MLKMECFLAARVHAIATCLQQESSNFLSLWALIGWIKCLDIVNVWLQSRSLPARGRGSGGGVGVIAVVVRHFLPESPKALEEDWERSGSGAPDLPNG